MHALRPHTARDTDGAALPREIREKLRGLIHDAGSDRDRPHLRRAHVRAGDSQVVEVEARVGPRRVQDPPGRAAHVEPLELRRRTARFAHDVAERCAKGDLVHAGMGHRPGHRYELGARANLFLDHEREPRERLDARDERRPQIQSLRGRVRRSLARHRAARFEDREQRRLLAAHETSRPEGDLDGDPKLVLVIRDRALDGRAGLGGAGMEINEGFLRIHGVGGDGDASQRGRGVTREKRSRQRASGIGVVPIRDDVRLPSIRVAPHRTKLVGERVARPTPSAKTALLDRVDELLGQVGPRALECTARLAVEDSCGGPSRHRWARRRV